MEKALITGMKRQDGAYLAVFVPDKGHDVHGIKRRSSLLNTDHVEYRYQSLLELEQRYFCIMGT